MELILGIDAAWSMANPSGVALLGRDAPASRWRLLRAAPSYGAFVLEGGQGPVAWLGDHPVQACGLKDVFEVIRGRWAGASLRLVAVDMPLASGPEAVNTRRPSDNLISKAFGAMGCGTHSPTKERPGLAGIALQEALRQEGIPLVVDGAIPQGGAIEVYPHPAIMRLLGLDYRLEYKIGKSGRFWPGVGRKERKVRLMEAFKLIHEGLQGEVDGIALPLPEGEVLDGLPFSRLKLLEDGLDALVCAWVGICAIDGRAVPYGDKDTAIWVPSTWVAL